MRCVVIVSCWLGVLVSGLLAEGVAIYGRESESAASPAPAAPAAPVVTTEPAKPVAPAAPTGSNVTASGEMVRYTVAKGDSLWKVSRQFKVTIESIRSANNLKSDTIRVGQVLLIPTSGPPVLEQGQEIRRAIPVDPATLPRESVPPAAAPTSSRGASEPVSRVAAAPVTRSAAEELRRRLVEEVRVIASKGVRYNGSWRPPGERTSWVMDCSNTTRWLYKRVAGVELERTASSQYHQFYLDKRAWLAPKVGGSQVNVAALQRHLREGDLLFWEHTYRPVRTPPITHVMIYVGRDEAGRMLMVGSQGSRGKFNRAGSGPDLYYFDPNKRIGGYRTGLFGSREVQGRFIAFARPLA